MSTPINFLIIHGTGGNPGENWFPWLRQKLEKGGNVLIPQFPTPEGQSFEAWEKIAIETLADCTPADTVLIGHSIGAVFALRLAELASLPYKAVFAACPWTGDLGLPDFDPLNATFTRHEFDWQRVRRGTGHIVCIAGDDDPYVPLAYSKDVADRTEAEFIVVEKGGHLNIKAGYREFPLLLEKIQQLS